MENIILWSILGLLALVIIMVVSLVVKTIIVESIKNWLQDKRDKRKEQKKQKELIRQREEFSKIYLGNPVLESILQAFNIIIFGGLGAGKTLFLNLLCYYLNMKYAKEDYRNRRYNKFMRPEYLQELRRMQEKKQLRIYANMDLEDDEGNKSQDLWPALFQEKRVIENGIFVTDEFGEKLGKDLWQLQQSAKDPRIEKAIDTARFARQFKNIKWLGTEQSHDNIFKPIRDKGFLEIQALRTYVWISKWGKFKRKFLELCRKLLPGYFTTNVIAEFKKNLFLSDRIKTGFKLLLSTFIFCPQTYYRDITVTAGKIKQKHTNFQTIISIGKYERMFKFTNQEFFKYNTRAAQYRYDEQFDENGERLWQVN